jgi:hypothetical protein
MLFGLLKLTMQEQKVKVATPPKEIQSCKKSKSQTPHKEDQSRQSVKSHQSLNLAQGGSRLQGVQNPTANQENKNHPKHDQTSNTESKYQTSKLQKHKSRARGAASPSQPLNQNQSKYQTQS